MHDTNLSLKVEVSEISQVKKVLNITIPKETVKHEIDEAYHSLKSNVSVAGFRKGTIPMNLLKAKFSARVQEDVTTRLVEKSYLHALHEHELMPVAGPKIDVKPDSLQEGKDFSYTATVEISPKLEVGGYMGMELKKETIEVTDKDVEDGLKRLSEAKAAFKEVPRPAKDGDLVVVDFEGSVDGVTVKKSKTTDYPMLLGESTFLPGFEEALKGASKGDNKEAKVKFPDNYSEKDLAGKDAVFSITIKGVKERVIPALTDEFAKDMECQNLEELKTKVKEELIKLKDNDQKERLKTELLDKLIEKYQFEVPEGLVTRYLGALLNRAIDNIRKGYPSPGDNGLSIEELKARYREVAIRQVREDVVLDAIAAKEKIEISAQETEDAIKHLADTRKVSYESLMDRIEKEGALEIIKDGLKHEKVFNIIIASSKPAA